MNQARHHHAMVKKAYNNRQTAAKQRLMGKNMSTEDNDTRIQPELDSLRGKGVKK